MRLVSSNLWLHSDSSMYSPQFDCLVGLSTWHLVIFIINTNELRRCQLLTYGKGNILRSAFVSSKDNKQGRCGMGKMVGNYLYQLLRIAE